METKKSLNYLKAKKKVEILKHFYSHLVVFLVINTGIILISANVFGKGKTDFSDWSIYVTAFFWGIGLISHAIYVLFELYVNDNFLKRWEEKKIKQFLEEDQYRKWNRNRNRIWNRNSQLEIDHWICLKKKSPGRHEFLMGWIIAESYKF